MMSATTPRRGLTPAKALGPSRRLRKLRALQRAKSSMYEASKAGNRTALHEASGRFLRVARELGMSDAEVVRAAGFEEGEP